MTKQMPEIISHKYNFVYKTTNNINGNYYYGVHSTDNLNDGYLGSGKCLRKAISKYGESNFTREIVQYFSNVKNAYILEAAIVTSELVKDPHCYNIAEGGHGGYVIAGFTDDERKRVGIKISKANKGRKMSEEAKQNIRLAVLEFSKDPEWRKRVSIATKKAFTPEVRAKMSDSLKGRKFSEEHKKHMSESFRGRTISEETRQKISNTLKGTHLTESTKKKLSEITSNRIWITNEIESKRVKPEDLQQYLDNGYRRGRRKRK